MTRKKVHPSSYTVWTGGGYVGEEELVTINRAGDGMGLVSFDCMTRKKISKV